MPIFFFQLFYHKSSRRQRNNFGVLSLFFNQLTCSLSVGRRGGTNDHYQRFIKGGEKGVILEKKGEKGEEAEAERRDEMKMEKIYIRGERKRRKKKKEGKIPKVPEGVKKGRRRKMMKNCGASRECERGRKQEEERKPRARRRSRRRRRRSSSSSSSSSFSSFSSSPSSFPLSSDEEEKIRPRSRENRSRRKGMEFYPRKKINLPEPIHHYSLEQEKNLINSEVTAMKIFPIFAYIRPWGLHQAKS